METAEEKRLRVLREYNVLDTEAEQAFDDLTALAGFVCGTPIALLSLIDEKRQWFKAKVGVAVSETPREWAFCDHAIRQETMLIVENAMEDPRFQDNPLVTGETNIRFYAGAPLITPQGLGLGTLCVIDRKPRTITAEQKLALQVLGRQAVALLELRRNSRELAEALASLRLVGKYIPICAYCKAVRDDTGFWKQVEAYIASLDADGRVRFSHGICPKCVQTEGLF